MLNLDDLAGDSTAGDEGRIDVLIVAGGDDDFEGG